MSIQEIFTSNNISNTTPGMSQMLEPVWHFILTILFCVFGLILSFLIVCNIFYRLRLKRWLIIDVMRPDRPGFRLLMFDAIKGQSQKYTLKDKGGKDPRGIIIGLSGHKKFICSPECDEGHIYVNGGTGSGKTANILIPTLRVWQGNAFVIDISGDISKKTNKYRKNKAIFCPWSRNGMPYDVYYSLRKFQNKKLTPEIEDEINDFFTKLCFTLIPDDINLGDTERYYRNGGRAMLTAALVFYYRSGWDFIPSCKEFTHLDAYALLEKINYMDCDFIKTMTSQFIGENEKNVAGCKSSANSFILLYATKGILANHLRCAKAGEQSIYPDLIEKRDIYIIIPERQLTDYAPLLALLTAQMMNYIEQRKTNPNSKTILMCVDEFGRLGRLNKCKDFLQTARKRKARMIALGQSVADIELNYGEKEAESMLDNFAYKVCLESNHPQTQEYFANLVGKDYEEKATQGWGGTADTFGRLANKDYIIEPASLQYLKRDGQLLYVCPDGFAILKKYKYWKDRKRYPDDYVSRGKRK